MHTQIRKSCTRITEPIVLDLAPDLHVGNDGQELRLSVSLCQIYQEAFEVLQQLIMLSLLSLMHYV